VCITICVVVIAFYDVFNRPMLTLYPVKQAIESGVLYRPQYTRQRHWGELDGKQLVFQVDVVLLLKTRCCADISCRSYYAQF